MPRQNRTNSNSWQFFIDRGGTFTDIVGVRADGTTRIAKLLSVNPRHYEDAALQGIRTLLAETDNGELVDSKSDLPTGLIAQVRLGTTVATNALLERKGEPTVLVVNEGFQDALRIAYQNRPDIFARNIILPTPLYSSVIEVPGRFSSDGKELESFDPEVARARLAEALKGGINSCAIVFMHSYLYPEHELLCAQLAEEIGFKHVTMSHRVSPLIKLVARGDTTVADAYLSPILHRYLEQFSKPLQSTQVYFMQSNGGLTDRLHFRGKDSLLSGPAGGVVGAVETAKKLGFNKIIGFDMGGTSTDVSHYAGAFERQDLTTISGIRIRAPMIAVHTIAAGGGSILKFDGHRFLVGPESAGSNPGPACYRNGGPLTITDANLLLGRIQAEHFPSVFGEDGRQPLDLDLVAELFLDMKAEVGKVSLYALTEEIAWGFIEIAVEKMASAIKKITIERGYDVKDAVLNSFGGAGGQHACLIAEKLGIEKVMIHPMAGVLSAVGIGLSPIKVVLHLPIQMKMPQISTAEIDLFFQGLIDQATLSLKAQGTKEKQHNFMREVLIRYDGSDTTLPITLSTFEDMRAQFHDMHQQRFGFHSRDRELIIESLTLEATAFPDAKPAVRAELDEERKTSQKQTDIVKLYSHRKWWQAQVYQRDDLAVGETVKGPAIILDDTSTNIVEPGWIAVVKAGMSLVLMQTKIAESEVSTRKNVQLEKADPILLELFNNKFMAIAEEMGVTLCHTSQSVNIKERLDFSCALFDPEGKLIANAPHMPVHLGSMGESVRAVITSFENKMKKGDVYVLNNPYKGGTHLPDITVITPVFSDSNQLLFFTASRGHHADIGGITPGSMPPNSKHIQEEGALIDPMLLVDGGRLNEDEIKRLLTSCPHPSRNVEQNISDLKAQIAANNRGVLSINSLIDDFGLETVYAYMHFVRQNAEDCVRDAIDRLSDGEFQLELDDGAKICVKITLDKATRSATIDFAGTSEQQNSNLNAPRAITIAAVLYVFRTLVESQIPLNDGCLTPLNIIVPEGSMLNPNYPAAVVAGNVETSQAIVDAVYGALDVLAASQGTMNNFTFGNQRYQYYETICGGAGAGPGHNGCDAVHTHMTNSRLTDPEVLEWRFPVILKEFVIRKGSGGAGKYNGGNGVIRKLRFMEPMQASILSQRRRVAPFGLHGGEAGAKGRNYVIRDGNGSIENLSGTDTVEMNAGDIFVIETPGGGGWDRDH